MNWGGDQCISIKREKGRILTFWKQRVGEKPPNQKEAWLLKLRASVFGR